MRLVRVFATAACLLGLTGCESANKTLAFLHSSQSETAAGNASSAPPRNGITAPTISALPSAISATRSRRGRATQAAMPKPGSAWRPPMIGCAGSSSPTAPMRMRPRFSGPPRRSSTTRAIPICCGAITATPGRSSWPLATSIRAIRISRTTSICWRRARGQDSPDGAPRSGAQSGTIRGRPPGLRFAPSGLRGCRRVTPPPGAWRRRCGRGRGSLSPSGRLPTTARRSRPRLASGGRTRSRPARCPAHSRNPPGW